MRTQAKTDKISGADVQVDDVLVFLGREHLVSHFTPYVGKGLGTVLDPATRVAHSGTSWSMTLTPAGKYEILCRPVQQQPWVRVAASDLTPGMRLWEPDGRHDVFLRRETGRVGSMHMGASVRRVVFTGGMTGRECSLAVESWHAAFRVVREDVK